MIGRREFLTKTFKAIVGGTLILPYIPKVIYSFPTNIALPEWYTISAYDNLDFDFFAAGKVKLFTDRLNRPDAADEVGKLLVRLGIYDKYTSWHFYKVDVAQGELEGFIWSGMSVINAGQLHRSRESIGQNPLLEFVDHPTFLKHKALRR